MKITIITPTFNREKLIKNVWKSIKSQVFNDDIKLQWLIIDDGSTDNTKKVVDNFKSDHIKVSYYKQNNTGVIGAITKGFELAEGKLAAVLDSDDELLIGSIQKIYDFWINNANKNTFSANYQMLNKNKRLGKKFKKVHSNTYRVWMHDRVYGDKFRVYNMNLRSKYKFNLINNERFIPEASLYFEAAKKYDSIFSNEVIVKHEYEAGGITDNMYKVYSESPKSTEYFVDLIASMASTMIEKIVSIYILFHYKNIMGWNNKIIFNKTKSKFLFLILMIPFGAIHWFKKREWRRQNKKRH